MNNMKIPIIIIVVIIIVLVGIYAFQDKKEYGLKTYFFNAGKADCILISNNGKYIMIDTGEESLSTEILAYFKNNNITKLDYLIITHFDKDHVGSASKIIDNIEVENVLQSNSPKESTYYDNYINSLANKNITPQTISGDVSFNLGDLEVIVNGPETLYTSDESNNSSLIVSIKYKDTSYLFMGDSQNDRIKDYLNNHNETYDFIKIPYHGHYQKKLNNLLKTVQAKYAVITSSNTEPEDEETIALLKELNTAYYLTRNGSVTVLADGNEIKIKQN
ncbi:MAG: MBL fold metallo-hydrolase [Clostridia bacterium]|nr:MBL fold metallo-hydrolase [Clostridia bacterium]